MILVFECVPQASAKLKSLPLGSLGDRITANFRCAPILGSNIPWYIHSLLSFVNLRTDYYT